MAEVRLLDTVPALILFTGDANVHYDSHNDHVTRFYAANGTNSPHLANPMSEQELVARC